MLITGVPALSLPASTLSPVKNKSSDEDDDSDVKHPLNVWLLCRCIYSIINFTILFLAGLRCHIYISIPDCQRFAEEPQMHDTLGIFETHEMKLLQRFRSI